MINFYKEDGTGKIEFANGDIVEPAMGQVTIFVDDSTNTLIFAVSGRDKYFISTFTELRVNGDLLTGTNQEKADLIAPVFQLETGSVDDLTEDEKTFIRNLKASYEATT